jgi:hypothetical protein
LHRTKQTLPPAIAAHPTTTAYIDLVDAYHFFNERLFSSQLPGCIITFQRKARARGYYSRGRFGLREGSGVVDEIALNPQYFRGRTDAEILSTLAHEMVHLQQAHFGAPSATPTHDTEWADMMTAIGLIPSATGRPGGARTGRSMTHYIEAVGPFDRAVHELLADGRVVHVVDRVDPAIAALRTVKKNSKSPFCCPGCGATIWGKPTTNVICGGCMKPLVAR